MKNKLITNMDVASKILSEAAESALQTIPRAIDYLQRPDDVQKRTTNPHGFPCYRCNDKHVSTMTRNTCKRVCERRKEFLRRHCTTRFTKEEL